MLPLFCICSAGTPGAIFLMSWKSVDSVKESAIQSSSRSKSPEPDIRVCWGLVARNRPSQKVLT